MPDGYARRGEHGLVLIDPQVCPAGHPFRFGERSSLAQCRAHGPHLAWRCACGQTVYRHAGAFWGGLECLSSRA